MICNALPFQTGIGMHADEPSANPIFSSPLPTYSSRDTGRDTQSRIGGSARDTEAVFECHCNGVD